MKKICFLILIGSLFISCEKEQKSKVDLDQKNDNLTSEVLEEDCDDKLEKINEEPAEISLDGAGDQGCTID